MPLTEVYVPNTFTPNGDNHNELFVVHGLNIKNFKMDIVDRWGALVFQTTDMYKYWDGKYNGKLIPQGIYMYSIEILGQDMKEFNKIGTIQIIY